MPIRCSGRGYPDGSPRARQGCMGRGLPAYMGVIGSGFTGFAEPFNAVHWCQETLFYPTGTNPGTRWIKNVAPALTITCSTVPSLSGTLLTGWELHITFAVATINQRTYWFPWSPGFPDPIPQTMFCLFLTETPGWVWGGDIITQWERGNYSLIPPGSCT